MSLERPLERSKSKRKANEIERSLSVPKKKFADEDDLRMPSTIFNTDKRTFKKKTNEPSLLLMELNEIDFTHLAKDDIDKLSKLELTYKILKD
jgi:hypothetical protein